MHKEHAIIRRTVQIWWLQMKGAQLQQNMAMPKIVSVIVTQNPVVNHSPFAGMTADVISKTNHLPDMRQLVKLPHATHITGIVEVYKTTKEIFLYVQKFLFSDIRHVI